MSEATFEGWAILEGHSILMDYPGKACARPLGLDATRGTRAVTQTYRPLTIHEGHVEVVIERSPYCKSGHIYQFKCGICGQNGWYHRRQRDACDDAYDHINEHHLAIVARVH